MGIIIYRKEGIINLFTEMKIPSAHQEKRKDRLHKKSYIAQERVKKILLTVFSGKVYSMGSE